MLMLMLWSAPRSRSTAFYRMMIERGDFTGVHEPFSHVAVFGNVEISGGPLATAPGFALSPPHDRSSSRTPRIDATPKPSPAGGSWPRTHSTPS